MKAINSTLTSQRAANSARLDAAIERAVQKLCSEVMRSANPYRAAIEVLCGPQGGASC